MTQTITPGCRAGQVHIPASKSQAHRLLICAALGTGETLIHCDGISKDIAATIDCLHALGASITIDGDRLHVRPVTAVPTGLCHLYCGESGSTLRFLLPIVGALGAEAVFHREGRLPERPLAPLDSQLTAHGMELREQGSDLYCAGQLRCGDYRLPGNVSSQYISGLLMALPFVSGDSTLTISGPIESAAYITMTEDALTASHVTWNRIANTYHIPGDQQANLPGQMRVEGDYSNGAFFLCLGAVSENGVMVNNLTPQSHQGDKGILDILTAFGACVDVRENGVFVQRGAMRPITIDAAPIPDLVPVLSVLACAAQGETRVIHAERLRIKESDRLQTTAALINSLGGDATETADGLIIRGTGALTGGTVDSFGDHRIAMSAAVAACLCAEPVTITGAQAVNKSYPRFWEDLSNLKGDAL